MSSESNGSSYLVVADEQIIFTIQRYSNRVIRSWDVAMASEGSNDIYCKGKIECLWLALLPNVKMLYSE
jgi:hypothetical protein